MLSAGLLLRLFHLLYNCDVVEEEVYHSWKEDIAQDFPGKEKALFQVREGGESRPHTHLVPIFIPTFVHRGKIPFFPLQTEVRMGIGTGFEGRGEGRERVGRGCGREGNRGRKP